MNLRLLKPVITIAFLAIALVILPSSLRASTRGNLEAQNPESIENGIANCRYGAAPLEQGQQTVLPTLGAGWYLNFGAGPWQPAPANDATFVHMINVQQDKVLVVTDPKKQCNCPDDYRWLSTYTVSPKLDAQFANYLKNNPGKTHIVGNEVDRFMQGEMYPPVYAQAYHDIYKFIKGNDPTAQVAISGLVQVTPGRLQYLDRVWFRYRSMFGNYMPVDVWTMHIYVLPELLPDGKTPNGIANIALGTDVALGKRESGGNASLCSQAGVYCYAEHDDIQIFAEHVVSMRKWMKDHGQQNKPLLLTEYSILYPYITFPNGSCDFLRDEFGNCFTPARVTKFMNATFDYLNTKADPQLGYPLDNNRLVQQWMWFAVNTKAEGQASNLAQDNLQTLTQMGQNFRDYVAKETLYQNLLIDKVANVSLSTEGAPTVDANIAVTFRNNGNKKITKPFTVTFYKDATRTQVIGSVTVDPGVEGCASFPYTVSVPWNDLPRGKHTYYVYVNSDGAVEEFPPGNTDNIGVGSVTVYAHQLRLPVIRRSG